MPTASTPFSQATPTPCRPSSCWWEIVPSRTPADLLVMGKIQSYQLSHNYEIEALRARLREKFGIETASWLLPSTKPGDPVTTEPTIGSTHAEEDSVKQRIGVLTGLNHGASNEWVVAGARTITGKPILANDPHLELAAPISGTSRGW